MKPGRHHLLTGMILFPLLGPGPLWAQPTDTPAHIDLELEFAARVGQAPFVCGQRYPAPGHEGLFLVPTDLRFYISEVELINRRGQAVPLQLAQDNPWQHGTLALLDFEPGSGACRNGTAPLNTRISGTLPAGDYRGLRFTLGVPFEDNHRLPTLAPSPLNLTALFWVWQSGYKFFKFDARTPDGSAGASGFSIHLGSTGCSSASRTTAPARPCRFPNRVSVTLQAFEPQQQRVVLDIAALLQGSRVDFNSPETPPGCMSGQDDPDCRTVFRQLGLPFGPAPGGQQRIFRSEPKQ